MAVAVQRLRRPLQIDRVPPHDSRRHQIEAAGPIALLLKAAVADFAQPVEEHGAGQCIARFALVQSSLDAAAQLDALQATSMNNVRSMRPSSRRATARPFSRSRAHRLNRARRR